VASPGKALTDGRGKKDQEEVVGFNKKKTKKQRRGKRHYWGETNFERGVKKAKRMC